MKKKNKKIIIERKKTFFGNWKPVDYEDLGYVRNGSIVEDGETIITKKICNICGDTLKVGKKDNKVFLFCNRCFVVK